jgi:hypothetical protein
MRDHDALGSARRAGGIDEISEVLSTGQCRRVLGAERGKLF